MSENHAAAISAAKSLIHAFIERRDALFTVDCCAQSGLYIKDDIFFSGTDPQQFARDKESFSRLARRSAERFPAPLKARIADIAVKDLGGLYEAVSAQLQVSASREDANSVRAYLRINLLLEKDGERRGLCVLQIQASPETAPASPSLSDRDRPADPVQTEKDIEELARLIPGGVCSCCLDKHGTFDMTTEGFYSTLRCTPEDLQTLYSHTLCSLVYEKDRKRIRQEILQYLKCGSPSSIEHRVLLRDGSLRWFQSLLHLAHYENGERRLFMLYTDIDDQRRIRERIIMSEARYNLIMDLSDSIIYEWNIQDDTVEFSSVFQKKFGYPPATERFLSDIERRQNVHPDDIREHKRALTAAKNGSPYEESIVRFRKTDGDYLWCKIVLGTLFDESKLPARAVGIMIDIDDQMRQTLEYRSKMMRDPMTKLYNKDATETLIKRALDESPNQEHAFIIIDLDDFKQINDTYGHQKGDSVIKESALRIQSLFRVDDIVGRIGGDEFVVFLKNVKSLFLLVKKVKMIRDAFQEPLKCMESPVILSCSIGISLYPRHGAAFEELYDNADIALYEAKRQGKDQHYCFQPHMLDRRHHDATPSD